MSLKDKPEAKYISDIVGEWGRWQLNLSAFVFVVISLNAYGDLSYSFHAYDVDYWCRDIPIESKNNISLEEYRCLEYTNPNQTCNQWEYNTTDFHKTIITEFDLVCDRSNYASLSQSFFMLGYLITGVLLSQYADKYGRKPLVWVSFVLQIISWILGATAVNIWMYSISRLLLGLAIYGCSGPISTSLLESCGPKHRSDIYMGAGFGWVFGYVMLPGIAFWLKDFRIMNWFGIVPIIICMVWFRFIPESPRWLITKGRTDEAEAILKKIVKQNRLSAKNFDQKFLQFRTHISKNQTSNKTTKTYNMFDLVKTPNLRNYTLIFWFSWTVLGLVYYGFTLNMGDFGGNFYITFLLSGIVELPSSLISILALRYMSRRMALITFLSIIIISSLAIIPTTDPNWKVTFALFGKFSVGSLWWIYEIYVPEVYPTVLRNTGAGTSSSFSRLGSMASPFMKNLAANTSLSVVMVLYAFLSLCSAILALFLPETKGTEIPDTLDDVKA